MIIYEVTATVQHDAANDYREWLFEHVAAMLRFDGFQRATIAELVESTEASRGFVVSYFLSNQESLDRYLAENAAAMRADGERLFGGHFTATRRVMTLIVDLQAETS